MEKYGIALPKRMAEQVEAPLEYGDSRSKRIRELVSIGLAAEDVMTQKGVWPRTVQERRDLVRSALHEYVLEEY